MTIIAFVNIETGTLYSTFNTSMMYNPLFPGIIQEEQQEQQEYVTPDGCIDIPIPSTIISMDAIKAIVIDEAPGFTIVNDDEKLAKLRARALPHVRETRNQLIAMSDWRVMPDSPLTPEKRAEWMAYRQALRDLPSTTELINPVYPQMPS
jgi:hypothetical protein